MNSLFKSAYQGRRVLVTGHTGFKGSWLIAWLLELGAEVCGYADDVPTDPSLFGAAGLAGLIRHEVGDIRDISRLQNVIKNFGPDFVFHLAAQAIVSTSYVDPLETLSINVIGTAAVLEALRTTDIACTAIIITSDKAYDNVEWLWGYRENDVLGGKDPYSASKGAAELVCKSYKHSFFSHPGNAIRLATTRAGNVIGGGDWAKDRIVADCVRSWLKDEKVLIRSPRATRPWQHVLEPLSGYLCLGSQLTVNRDLHGESFNFGPKSDQNASVIELLTSLAQTWGFATPEEAYHVANEIPFHEAGLLKLNIDKAWGALRWQPTLTYTECVELTATWYRDVLKCQADPLATTQKHIAQYTALAVDRRQSWVDHVLPG